MPEAVHAVPEAVHAVEAVPDAVEVEVPSCYGDPRKRNVNQHEVSVGEWWEPEIVDVVGGRRFRRVGELLLMEGPQSSSLPGISFLRFLPPGLS